MGAAADLFCAAKAAEGASPRTVEWYQMILAAELRAWLLELRTSLRRGRSMPPFGGPSALSSASR